MFFHPFFPYISKFSTSYAQSASETSLKHRFYIHFVAIKDFSKYSFPWPKRSWIFQEKLKKWHSRLSGLECYNYLPSPWTKKLRIWYPFFVLQIWARGIIQLAFLNSPSPRSSLFKMKHNPPSLNFKKNLLKLSEFSVWKKR